jgi:hypothetical protein
MVPNAASKLSLLIGQTRSAVDEVSSNVGSLIFMGLFFLALIALGIWWLRR